MPKKTAVAMAVIALALVGFLAQDAGTAPTLTAQDHAEINQLYARYSYGVDTQADDGWLYARTFTEDGEFEFGAPEPAKGRAQLRELARPGGGWDQGSGGQRSWHVLSNILIEPTADGANGTAYLLLVSGSEAGVPVVTGRGIYTDELVKTAEGWLFENRAFHAGDFPSDMRQTAQ